MALKSIVFKNSTFNISYEILNPEAKYDTIFLHGWGSNKNIMKQAFSKELSEFRHIYVDMPGFGNSTCNIALTTDDYATILEQFFAQVGIQKEIILGHSFGGKVATLLEPSLLVLLSTAGIKIEKSFNVKAKIAIFKLFKNIGLQSLRKYFVASDAKTLSECMYTTFKNVVDEDFSTYFKRTKSYAYICWGESDTATPLSSGKSISTLIAKNEFTSFKGDHYFFLHHAKAISEGIVSNYLKINSH